MDLMVVGFFTCLWFFALVMLINTVADALTAWWVGRKN